MTSPSPIVAAERFTTVLELLAVRLDELLQAMRSARRAYVSPLANRLEQASIDQQPLADRVRELQAAAESARRELVQAAGAPAQATVAVLARGLPAAPGQRLLAAAATARAKTMEVGVELRLGAKLLQLASRAQEGLLRAAAADSPRHYDRRARATSAPRSGNLLQGTI